MVINSASLLWVHTYQKLFDALTLAVSNKDLEEFSDNCTHNQAKKFCPNDIFLRKFPTFIALFTILCFMRFMSKKNRNLAHCGVVAIFVYDII